MRTVQGDHLAAHSAKLNIASDPTQLKTRKLQGIVLANELFDALPFHTLSFTGNSWNERRVSLDSQGNLLFTTREIEKTSDLYEHTNLLGRDFPDGYQTEVRTNFLEILQQMDSAMENPLLLLIDYGFARPEYYNPGRVNGTLRTFSNHRAGDDPFESPGNRDLTAHVDFTHLAEVAATLGFTPTSFSPQGSYLTHWAKPRILAGKLSSQKTIHQFQTLTHPGHLGSTFHIIELQKEAEIDPVTAHRLALEP